MGIGVLIIALRALSANPGRAALTIFGILVGVASVTTLVAYSAGQQKEMLKVFDRFGATRLSADIPFWRDDIPPGEELTLKDAQAIKDKCWTVQAVAMVTAGRGQARYGERTKDDTSVMALQPAAFFIYDDYKITDGRSFSAAEDSAFAQVCILGYQTKYDLFLNEPALGQYIYAAGQRFEVIGVLEKLSDAFGPIDDSIMIPYSTGRALLPDLFWMSELVMKVKDYKYMGYAEQQVRDVLYLQHPHLEVPDREDPDYDKEEDEMIWINSVYEAREQRKQAAESLSRFLIVMGALALMIGAVGVMNIMLVSVEERTQEIGLRKALGASSRAVLGQFLTEAVVICTLGGALGAGVALTACRWIERLPDEIKVPDPILSTGAVVAAIVVTAAVGIAAGMYPALNAAALNPIEALRHE